MGYRFLEHATDAVVEVTAGDLKEALMDAAGAVIDLTLDRDSVRQLARKEFSAEGEDLRYLLFSWVEEITFVLITEGFAIGRIEFEMGRNGGYRIDATAYGEPIDLERHGFKVEIKAPTFHDMEIREGGGGGEGQTYMRFLLDL